MKSVSAQASKISQLYSYLEQVEYDKIHLSADEKQQKYDQLEALQSSREAILEDKAKIREPLELINTIGNWVFTLERLKNGRWTRFGASEADLIKITLLQAQMSDRVLALYSELLQAIGTTKGIQAIGKEIERLSDLSKELNEDLGKYIKLYGVESFNNN